MPEECVKVFVRVRPISEKEAAKNLQPFIFPDGEEKQLTIQDIHGDKRKNKLFSFDDIFTEHALQKEIFEATCRSLTTDVLHGYNGTILAYGQTGSGKTHTMMGDLKKDEERGIIPRAFEAILDAAKANSTRDFLIMCSYVELYNEEIRDLLHVNDKFKLELRESAEKGVFIKDLKKVSVTCALDMLRYLKIGNQNRTTGETLMNSESSRSHSIFTIYVESLDKCGENIEKFVGSKFNLVDLAGSERQSKTGSVGERFVEATKINLSLTALGKVISSLVERRGTFIPYRDSKLTRLLQDSLGGNAKTVMIATISPSSWHFQETLSTLKYASRAKYITNVPVINQDPKDALLKEYQEEIKRLRVALKEIQKEDQPQVDQLKEENMRIATQAEKEKKELIMKIRKLQEQFICSPHQIAAQLKSQQNMREQKLSYMEKNYKNVEEEVRQMKGLLNDLRKKYKNASKEIFQLESEHQKEREAIREESEGLRTELKMSNTVLNVLFTEKQLRNIMSLGSWEEDKYRLPKFYFKDRYTLAFPCEDEREAGSPKKQKPSTHEFENEMTTATSFGKLSHANRAGRVNHKKW